MLDLGDDGFDSTAKTYFGLVSDSDSCDKNEDVVIINLATDQIWHKFTPRKEFQGGCIDTGAQKCVTGKMQAKAYCKFAKLRYQLLPSNTRFRFTDGDYQSLGKLPVRIPLPNHSFIHHEFDVVRPDVPMLLGLYFLDSQVSYANNAEKKLVSPFENWSIPITRKFGNLYPFWNIAEICFRKSELLKMHRLSMIQLKIK